MAIRDPCVPGIAPAPRILSGLDGTAYALIDKGDGAPPRIEPVETG